MPSDRLVRFRRVRDVVVISAFLAAIAAPGLLGLVRPSFDAASENRLPTPFPALTSEALPGFPTAFERWFADRFGFRLQLVRAQARLKLALGVSPSPLVLVGRQHWLFYRGERNLDSFLRTSPFSEDELTAYVTHLEQRRAWLAARGIHYLFVVAPDKEVIYPEFVPLRPRDAPSRLDQLAEGVRARTSVDFLDLRKALGAARATGDGRLYYLTDTHWNERGAYVAYLAILKRLQRTFPSLVPLGPGDLEMRTAVKPGGDLALMMQLSIPEVDYLARVRMPRSEPSDPGVPTVPNTPPYARPVARVLNDPALPRALVLRDSFAGWLIPFLSENFHRSVYLFTHDLDPGLVVREHPDVVIEEIVQRYLLAPPFPNRPEVAEAIQGVAGPTAPGEGVPAKRSAREIGH